MLGIGEKFPVYSVTATVSRDKNKAFETITSESYPGKWKVYFFWPKDFTFVCPTEIAAFGKINNEFQDRDTQVLGGSVDSEFVHLAWRNNHEDLKDLPFPMLADVRRDLTEQLGILDPEAGVAQRATFIVDRKASSASFTSRTCPSAAIRRKCSVCSMRCRLMSFAPATGKRAKRRSSPKNHNWNNIILSVSEG